jgi:hypothetical protein
MEACPILAETRVSNLLVAKSTNSLIRWEVLKCFEGAENIVSMFILEPTCAGVAKTATLIENMFRELAIRAENAS